MATKKIRELTQATSTNDTDVMIIEDAVDTKYITFANLITGIKNKITSVASLATARHIDGMSFDGTEDIAHRAACTTAATTVAKTAVLSGYALKTGGWVAVNFSNGNTASAATLNVNSTGDKSIYYKGAAVPIGYITAGATLLLVYNGTRYDIVGELCQSQVDSLQPQIDALNSNLEIGQSQIDAINSNIRGNTIGLSSLFNYVSANENYVLPSFNLICVCILQTGSEICIQSVIGVQGTLGSVISAKVGANGTASVQRNSVGNCYVAPGSIACRAMVFYL